LGGERSFMRVSIGAKIFGIAIALLLFMAAVFALGQGMARQASRHLTTVVENYVPIYRAVAHANLRSVEESADLRGMWVILLDKSDDPLSSGLRAGVAGAPGEIAALIAEARGLIAHGLAKVPDSTEAVLLARLDERLIQLGELATPYEAMVKRMGDALRDGDHAAFDGMRDPYFALRDSINQKFTAALEDILDLIRHSADEAIARQNVTWHLNLGILALALLIAIPLAAGVTIGLVRPLRRLLAATREIAAGKLDLPPAPVTSRDEIGELTAGFNQMVKDIKLKTVIRDLFGKYMDTRVVDQLINAPERLDLEGSRQEMTVAFSDMQGFTNLGERLTPTALVNLINRYLTTVSEAIRLQGGVIDKYIGDAIMAYWGPPFTSPEDHAVCACRAALDELVRFHEFADAMPEIVGVHGLPPVGLRIGIASGDVVVGSIGSESARAYTLIGDRVNLAARIEKATRVYDVPILISERTAALAAEAIEVREIDTIQVRGKSEPQRVFELLGRKGELDGHATALQAAFATALAAYRAGEWATARTAFAACLEHRQGDGPARLFLKRIAQLERAAPSGVWDGIWRDSPTLAH
jgi:class 3 adenylate cyclase/HAMP domain-containing protein